MFEGGLLSMISPNKLSIIDLNPSLSLFIANLINVVVFNFKMLLISLS